MYAKYLPRKITISYSALFARRVQVCSTLCLSLLLTGISSLAQAQPEVIRNITQPSERLELTVNSSRILTLDKRIPKMVVNNPELVTATPISANQVQLAARKPGVTQINLWDEEDRVYTVDVMIYGDVRELEHALKRLFPESSVKVVRLTNSLVLEGFVERPEAVSPILRLAEDYAPKVVNNITVGGVQQVLLKVKVMEVSRTKLRTVGIDWAHVTLDGTSVASSISGIINVADSSGVTHLADNTTFQFAVFDGGDTFFGFLEALQQNDLAKILADPTITAVSGRPAHFNVGGEFPIIVPSGLGQSTVEFKAFGTQVDFVPIVLGNGNIRLEVRPRVSELDSSRGVVLDGQNIPALRVREVDTGVELKAGQTLALAGLVQTRVEAQERGLPFLSDLPYVGTAFRRVEESVNEIELLIMVTPEFVDGIDPHEVPPCGPGMETVSPSNCQLYFGGHLEVPSCGPCGPYNYPACGPQCGTCGSNPGMCGSNPGMCGSSSCGSAGDVAVPTHDYGAIGGEYVPQSTINLEAPSIEVAPAPPTNMEPAKPLSNPGAGLKMELTPPQETLTDPSARNSRPTRMVEPQRNQIPVQFSRDNTQYRNSNSLGSGHTATPGLIGPIGYDVEK